MELIAGGLFVAVFYLLPAWLVWKDPNVNDDQKVAWVFAASVFSWFGYIAFLLTHNNLEETKH